MNGLWWLVNKCESLGWMECGKVVSEVDFRVIKYLFFNIVRIFFRYFFVNFWIDFYFN